MPKVSVVIASYQHAPYVRQSIESVLSQSFRDFEILVTDDGSRDGTVDVVRSVEDFRIKLEVFPENRGACVAMNAAIARATGEYIAILNSDDYWLPGKLERQVAFLDNHPDLAAVFALPKIVDYRGRDFPNHPFNRLFEARSDRRHSWLRRFFFDGNSLCHPTLLIRRKCYAKLGGYDPRLSQLPDFDMWIRLASHYDFEVLPERLTAFRALENDANASAPRPDVHVRGMWEYERVLHNFTALSDSDFQSAFAADIKRNDLESCPKLVALGRLAMTAPHPCHHAFGLSVLYDAIGAGLPMIDGKELAKLLTAFDPFGITARNQSSALNESLVALNESLVALKESLNAAYANLRKARRKPINNLHRYIAWHASKHMNRLKPILSNNVIERMERLQQKGALDYS